MLSKSKVLEIFRDKYYQQYFPSRNGLRKNDEWTIANLGFLSDDEVAAMVVVARPPVRLAYNPTWWQRLTRAPFPEDELEVLARLHIWTIRRQCEWIEENRQALQQVRFKSADVLGKMLKESRADAATE